MGITFPFYLFGIERFVSETQSKNSHAQNGWATAAGYLCILSDEKKKRSDKTTKKNDAMKNDLYKSHTQLCVDHVLVDSNACYYVIAI